MNRRCLQPCHSTLVVPGHTFIGVGGNDLCLLGSVRLNLLSCIDEEDISVTRRHQWDAHHRDRLYLSVWFSNEINSKRTGKPPLIPFCSLQGKLDIVIDKHANKA